MRWFKRSVVLCVLALVLTPARADAWFEWLDYLSGPGPWYGAKVDLRVWCPGPKGLWKGLRDSLNQAMADTLDPTKRSSVVGEWDKVPDTLIESNRALPMTDQKALEAEVGKVRDLVKANLAPVQSNQEAAQVDLQKIRDVLKVGEDMHRALDKIERGATTIASTGIFLSLCRNDKMRSLAVEVGFTSLQAFSNPDYAGDHSIRMRSFTAGLSYRLPLPPDKDYFDIGANVGVYRFSSRGFDSFSGLIIEPVFVDVHGPTKLIEAGGLKQLAALVTVRVSLINFPEGFDGAQFASVASKPQRISGGEFIPSATVFFNLTPLFWRRPGSPVPRLPAGAR